MENLATSLANFHFLRPWLLAVGVPVIVLLFFFLNRGGNEDGWKQYCDPALLKAMQIDSNQQSSRVLLYLYWPIALLTVLALAGPAFRQQPTPVFKNQAEMVIVLDVSKSMLAEDIKPSRLQRAKYKIDDILADNKAGKTDLQIGFVVYSGNAFVVTPISDDADTIISQAKAVSPDIMPSSGSNTYLGLEKALQLLKDSNAQNGQILLITDDEQISTAYQSAAKISASGYRLNVLGVGTAQGAPISYGNGGFIKDRQGNIVITKLNSQDLSKLAQDGNGKYHTISHDNSDLDSLLQNQFSQADEENNEQQTHNLAPEALQYYDDGIWLLLLIAPLTLLLFRRGLLMGVACLVLAGTFNPQPAYAQQSADSTSSLWNNLWKNKDQQAWALMQSGEHEAAIEKTDNSQITSAANYKNKDFEAALEQYQQLVDNNDNHTADDYYNLGNAQAQSGELEKAIESYDKAIELDANNDDAKYNRNIVKKELDKQNQQQQNQQQQNQQQQNQQQQNQQQQNQQQQNQQQQNQQQQNQQQQNQQQQNQQQQNQQQQNQQQQNQQQQNQQQQNQQQDKDGKESEQQQAEQQQAEQQSKDDKKAEQQQADKRQGEENKEGEETEQQAQAAQASEESQLEAEQRRQLEQWMRKIEDDPGGLLRRKFLHQYQNQQRRNSRSNQQAW